MSQFSYGGRMINFPLAKCSYSTDEPTAGGPSPWVHVYQDVHVIFDNYGASYPSSLIMKVLQGAKVLELVDLVEKIRENEPFGHQPTAAQYPTYTSYRQASSIIAIQYPIPDHKVRRIQLRFSSAPDFEAVLATLKDLGCPLRHVLPENAQQSRPATAASSIGSALQRPVQPQRSDSRPSSSLSCQTPLEQGALLPSEATHRASDGHSSSPLTFLPSSYRSMSSALGYAERPQSRASATLFPIGENEPHDLAPRSLAPSASVTLSAMAQLENDMAALVPPRRELPFKRPSTATSGRDASSPLPRRGSSSRPPSSLAGLPPLPQPSFSSTSTSSIPKPSTITKASILKAKAKETTINLTTRPSTARASTKKTSTPAELRDFVTPARPSTALPRLVAPKVKSHAAVPLTPVSIDAQMEDIDEQGSGRQVHSQNLQTAFGSVDAAMVTSPINPHSDNKENLAKYAALPYDDRMSIIETIIIGACDNENFITLCEDVYGCWQRIGLDPK